MTMLYLHDAEQRKPKLRDTEKIPQGATDCRKVVLDRTQGLTPEHPCFSHRPPRSSGSCVWEDKVTKIPKEIS